MARVGLASSEDDDDIELEGHSVDEMSGKALNRELVIAARKGKMQAYFGHKTCDKVMASKAIRVTGKQHIVSMDLHQQRR